MVKGQLENSLGIKLIVKIGDHIKEVQQMPQYLLGGSYNFDCHVLIFFSPYHERPLETLFLPLVHLPPSMYHLSNYQDIFISLTYFSHFP